MIARKYRVARSGLCFKKSAAGDHFELGKRNIVLCRIDQNREPGFLPYVKEFRCQKRAIDAAFAESGKTGARTTGLQ